jgi:hypothetical protein
VSAFVADDDGGVSAELTTDIEITNAAATATITGPSTAVVGVPVTIKVGADDPSPNDMTGTFSFTVDWGDGTPVVSMTGPADPPVTHTYTSPGTFTVTATATDPDGATSAPLTFAITVAQAPPTTTEPASTTTTSEPGSTTTTEPGVTTSSTSTTPGQTTSTSIAPDGGGLPRTGGAIGGALLAGVALLLAGIATVASTRRWSRSAATGGRSGG